MPGWLAEPTHGINEPVSAEDEAELMKFLRENMGNPPPVPYHSFLICLSVDEEQLLAHSLIIRVSQSARLPGAARAERCQRVIL